MIAQSPTLDQMGVFGRTVTDAALIAENIMAFDPQDPAMKPAAAPSLSAMVASEPPVPPLFALVRSPVWEEAEEDCQEAFDELADALGGRCEEISLPGTFDEAVAMHRTVHSAEMAKCYAHYHERGKDELSDVLRNMIEEGQRVSAVDYQRALDGRQQLASWLDEFFNDYDAIVTPATTGEAPKGLDATGSPIFCTTWTFCGTPAITLPLMEGSNGLPLGVQLVGARGDDARLLRTANWLSMNAATL